MDETTNQTQRTRHAYPCDTIHWNHKYVDVFSKQEGTAEQIDYSKFHLSEQVALAQLEESDQIEADSLDTEPD